MADITYLSINLISKIELTIPSLNVYSSDSTFDIRPTLCSYWEDRCSVYIFNIFRWNEVNVYLGYIIYI